MSSDYVLSSEQALDDYFSALLGEDTEAEIPPSPPITELDVEPELKAQPLRHEPESSQSRSYAEIQTEDFDVPNLEDVQKLLSQLESTDIVGELDIDSILEQNTVEIATLQDDILIQNNDIKLDVEPSVEVVDEIQSWDIPEEPSVDISVQTETTSGAVENIAEEVEKLDECLETSPVIEATQPEVDTSDSADVATESELETQAGGHQLDNWQTTSRTEDFQVLYFDVNGVTFAVPLDELGGIHQITELSHIIGKPSWYLGLQMNKEHQLDVVDSAKWVMAEKLANDDYKDNYQYIVMLGESSWGLASTELMGTELLNTDKVRWREQAGKRPWLAGMVKEKMCALIHVEAMVAMLNAGLDVKALD